MTLQKSNQIREVIRIIDFFKTELDDLLKENKIEDIEVQ